MANEELKTAVKQIIAHAKDGRIDQAYAGYRELIVSAAFQSSRPEDQRQVLKLMIHAKRPAGRPGETVVEAHRAAIPTLTALTDVHKEPADYELLGLCQVIVGDEKGASESFRTGLSIERERNPQSDLCGALMKWVASV